MRHKTDPIRTVGAPVSNARADTAFTAAHVTIGVDQLSITAGRSSW
jgi:hypothetical protein